MDAQGQRAKRDEDRAIGFFGVLKNMGIIARDRHIYYVVIGLEQWSLRRNNLDSTYWDYYRERRQRFITVPINKTLGDI